MRLTYEQLDKIKAKHNVDTLWSFSRFDTYRTSKWEYLLKYILKVKENNEKVSGYSHLGTACHELVQDTYEGKKKFEDLRDEFDDIWTTNIEIAGLYFDRTDSTKDENIKAKYYKDLIHFFENYKILPYKMLNEQALTIKISDDIVFIGYADSIYKNENDEYVIVDYKTSSRYSSKSLRDHSAQLVLYCEGLRQMGIPKEKIKCCFSFLKYVDIDCEQVNGKIKTRSIERHEIGEALQASCKVWLKKLGYEDKLVEYLDELAQTNDIKCLPEDVQTKYVIRDAETYIDDIWEFYEELREEIISTIAEINEKTEQYNLLKNTDIESAEQLFWDDDESLKAQSYYYNNLCGYSIPTIKPYKNWLDRINAEKSGDIFGNKPTQTSDTDDDDDMSWLNELA